MSTKAEQQRQAQQRANQAAKRSSSRAVSAKKAASAPNGKTRVSQKASYAQEPGPKGTSRKSTRSSANRSRPDAGLHARKEQEVTSPSSRYRQDAAQKTRVRGHGSKSPPTAPPSAATDGTATEKP